MSLVLDNDLGIRTAVQDELVWSPDVDAADIAVAVDDGVVTLAGEVENQSEALAAKRAAQRVRGVRSVVDNVEVKPRGSWGVSESEIAKEVEHALTWADDVPDSVKAEVTNHRVTLTGEVDWDFQRQAAKRAVRHLRGVHSVKNEITLTPRASADDIAEGIADAIVRSAQLDASKIDVTAEGNKVTLTGTVHSRAEKREANKAAWASPYVSDVDNRITVRRHGEE